MNLLKLEDRLVTALYHTNINVLNRVIYNKPELKEIALIEFNNFLLYIRKKVVKVYNYMVNDYPEEDFLIKVKTDNFNFIYCIHKDKTSDLTIILMAKTIKTYPPSFLTTKIVNIYGYVYFIKSEYGYKIGYTKSLNSRISAFIVNLPFKIELHSFVKSKNYEQLESTLHKLLDHKRLNGEWFTLTDNDFGDIDKILNNMELIRVLATIESLENEK